MITGSENSGVGIFTTYWSLGVNRLKKSVKSVQMFFLVRSEFLEIYWIMKGKINTIRVGSKSESAIGAARRRPAESMAKLKVARS